MGNASLISKKMVNRLDTFIDHAIDDSFTTNTTYFTKGFLNVFNKRHLRYLKSEQVNYC